MLVLLHCSKQYFIGIRVLILNFIETHPYRYVVAVYIRSYFRGTQYIATLSGPYLRFSGPGAKYKMRPYM
jgi:hypothetical protein